MAALALVAGVLTSLAPAAHAAPPPPVTFAPRTDLAAGNSPQSVALGDINGDSALDLVVANYGWEDFGPGIVGSVSVSLGDGAGGFGARTDLDLGNEVRSVALGDLNGDDLLDLIVTANGGIGKVWVLLGDGTGAFGPPSEYVLGDNFFGKGSAAVADLDGDGFLDVAAADSESVNVLRGTGTGGFFFDGDWGFTTNPVPGPSSVAAGHLNGDAFVDLASANNDGTVSVLLGNGDGTFRSATNLPVGSSARSVLAVDINDDTFTDLVASKQSGGVSVLLGNGDGTFQPRVDFAAGPGAGSLVAVDINGDNRLDLASASFDGDSVSVLVGDGAGAFAAPVDFATDSGPNAVAAGDLDGDHLADLVVANALSDAPFPGLGDPNPGPGTVSVLLNTTGMRPSAPTISGASAGPGQATVSWSPPGPDGRAPITGYVVTPYVGFFPLPATTFASLATTQTVAGLSNGTTYRFRVQAINVNGPGSYSKVTNPVTPAAVVPGPPTITRTATAGDQTATMSWTAPISDGGSPLIGYVITPYVGYWQLPPVSFQSTETTQTVAGLTNGVEYRFRVQAVNGVGTSGYSKVTNPVTPTA